jgi:hypothetical protein
MPVVEEIEEIHHGSNDEGVQGAILHHHDKALRPASRIALRKELIETPGQHGAETHAANTWEF